MNNLEYQNLVHELRGSRNFTSPYRSITNKFPKIRFIKHSRNKKCRGYFRKLYQSSILPFNIYLDGIYAFYSYMEEIPKDKRDEFQSKYIDAFDKDIICNVLKIASDHINGRIKIQTKQSPSPSGIIDGYRLIQYKFIKDKSYWKIWYSLDEMKVIVENAERKWMKIRIPYEY